MNTKNKDNFVGLLMTFAVVVSAVNLSYNLEGNIQYFSNANNANNANSENAIEAVDVEKFNNNAPLKAINGVLLVDTLVID